MPRAIWSGSIAFGLVNPEGGEKVYALLVKAMDRSGLAGIATYVMRDRQHLGCLRIREGVLTLVQMYFADEIRPLKELKPGRVSVARRELDMAGELIDRFRARFDIGKYEDDYREAQKGEKVYVEPAEREEMPDLLEALRASIAGSKGNGRRGRSARDGAGHNGDDLAGLSKRELVQRARREGLKGYSAMNKDELVEALS